MLSNEDIKQIFFYCDNKDPNGSYADDVDIFEFGKKVAAVAAVIGARQERAHCHEFVQTSHAEVATALEDKRGRL